MIGKRWRIGRALGSGACGSVHELEKVTSSGATTTTEYAVKVVPLPPPRTSKSKKRKKTPAELNADLLHFENTMYCSALNDLRGRFVPDTPPYGAPSKVPPTYGEASGHRYLVMERMAAPFSEVPSLLRASSARSARLGEVAAAMVRCVQAVHERRYLLVDVKPENFMLASGDGDAAARVRSVDLGLAESFHDVSLGGHRADVGAVFAGTPLYASVRASRGSTPSRRDDLEALAYVVVETVLTLVERRAASEGALPWSGGSSDEEILQIKEDTVDPDGDGYAAFFGRVRAGGNDEAADVVAECLAYVRGLKYKEKPDYDHLVRLMRRLNVYTGDEEQTQHAKPRRAHKAKATSDVEPTKPKKSKKDAPHPPTSNVPASASSSTRNARRSQRNAAAGRSNESAVVEVDDDDRPTETTARSPPLVDLTSDDDVGPRSAPSATEKNDDDASSSVGHRVTVADGPHAGESFPLDVDRAVIVGRDPSGRDARHALSNDALASSEHVSLVRTSNGLVRLIDLDSTNGTYVNGAKMRRGGARKLFSGDRIELGSSTLVVQKDVRRRRRGGA